MARLDDDMDLDGEDSAGHKKLDTKKILMIVLPLLIAIGLAVSFYFAFYYNTSSTDSAYSVVTRPAAEGEKEETTIVFYDLPELAINVRGTNGAQELAKIKINLELSKIDDIKTLESFIPRINDAIIAHTSELTEKEIKNSERLYWLKEELLYRINLILDPVKVNNLNFKNFEIVVNK